MTFTRFVSRRTLQQISMIGLFVCFFQAAMSVYADPVPEASAMASIQTTSPKAAVASMDSPTMDELLKNYMASMTYSPKDLALPTDPILPVPQPYDGPERPLSGTLNGNDADMELPVIAPPVEKAAKPVKAKRLSFAKPVANAVLSSPFGFRWGRMHEGVDLAVPQGTPIKATEAGRVTYSGWADGYGNFVSIDHGGGYSSRYGHASKLLVHAGQKVRKGQTIALVGSTGHSTGPHLHFELVSFKQHLNPLALLGKTFNLAIHDDKAKQASL